MKVSVFFVAILLYFGSFVVVSASMEPQALVEDVAGKTISRLKEDKDLIEKDPKYVHSVIDELLIPHFDFERMARWVLGKHWRRATADQKKAFVQEFKSLLIRTYSNSLQEYSDQTIKYLPFRDKIESGDVTVRSEIEQPGGFPIPINYSLYLKDNNWMVYDVSIDDVSLITNYRSSFSKEISKTGIDQLIQQLADKNK